MIAVSQLKTLKMACNVNQGGNLLFSSKAGQDFHTFCKNSYASQSQPVQNRLDEKTESSCMERDTNMNDGKKKSVMISFDFIRKDSEIKKETGGLVGIQAQRSLEAQRLINYLNFSQKPGENVKVTVEVVRDKVKGEIPSSEADICDAFTPKTTKDGDNKVKVFLQRISLPGMKLKIEQLCVANTQGARNSKLLKNDYDSKQEMDPLPTPGLIFDWSDPPVFPEYKHYEDNFQLKIPDGEEIPIEMLRIVSSVDAKPIEPPQYYLFDICSTEINPEGNSSDNLNKSLSPAITVNMTKSDVPSTTITNDEPDVDDSFIKFLSDGNIDLYFITKMKRKDLATKKKRYKKAFILSYKEFLQVLRDLPDENVPDEIFADEVDSEYTSEGDSEMEIEQEAFEPSPIKIKHEIHRSRVSFSTKGATYLRPKVNNYHPFHDHLYCPKPWPGLPEVVEDVEEEVDVLTVTNETDEEVQIQRKRGWKRGAQAPNSTVPAATEDVKLRRRATVRQPVRRAIVRQPARRVIVREPLRRMAVPFPKTHKTWATNSKKSAKLAAFKSRPKSSALRCKVGDAAKRKEHNIAERGRRANLRELLENLRKLVPGVREKLKAPTKDILTSASEYIKKLKECDIDLLQNRNNYLAHKLKQLKNNFFK